MSLNSPSENPGLFESLWIGLSGLIERLHKRGLSKTRDILNVQIRPRFLEFNKHYQDEQKAAEFFIVSTVCEYFFKTSFPTSPNYNPHYSPSEKDKNDRRAAALTLILFSQTCPEIFMESDLFNKLPQEPIREQIKEFLPDF